MRHLPPILGEPPNWRFGELASLKIAMICLGVIVALGAPKTFWQEYYWLVWLIFVIAMLAPTSKWLSFVTAQSEKKPPMKHRRAGKKV